MTDREILEYIDRLNNGRSEESIFIRHISENIYFAKVWPDQSKMTDEIDEYPYSYEFFFIKNEQNQYVGAVLDMKIDLHWYIVPSERKKGHLTSALKESILPYLFHKGRENQRITIKKNSIGEQNYFNSRKVAEKIGFKPINDDETEFELSRDNFNFQYENLDEKNGIISKSRFEELRKRLISSYHQLIKISDELLMTYGDDKDLREAATDIIDYNSKIEDIEWEYEKNKMKANKV